MSNQAKLKQILENIVNTKGGVKPHATAFQEVKTISLKKSQPLPLEQNKKTDSDSHSKENISSLTKDKTSSTLSKQKKIQAKTRLKDKKPNQKQMGTKSSLPNFTNRKPEHKAYKDDNMIKNLMSRKLQTMTKSEMEAPPSSPLQMHLVQSESLRIAQDKINDLEEELYILRQKNESLVSAGEILQDKNDLLKSKLEDIKYALKEEKNSFKEEKEVLLSALEEAKTQFEQLNSKKQELEKRLSNDLHGLHNRESSLESRIEILKMENSVLQREKDKKIIELKRQLQKLKNNLDVSHKKNQNLQTLNNKLQENSRRTVSALRATIYNLEGAQKTNDEVAFTDSEEPDKSNKTD